MSIYDALQKNIRECDKEMGRTIYLSEKEIAALTATAGEWDEIDEFVHSVDKDRLPFVFRFDESNLRDVIKQIPEDVFEALYKKINLDT